uniref:BTB domain-containing protein n=1 Tax=Setaria digitata TaxID=48799 RepID=A0A915Q6J4_9BILA
MIAGRLRSGFRNGAIQQAAGENNANYLMHKERRYRDGNTNKKGKQNSFGERHQSDALPKHEYGWTNTEKTVNDPETDMQMSLVETTNIFDFHLLLNIGGTHFRIRYSTIQYRCPTSLLAEFCRETHATRVERCNGYLSDTREYFFERSGKLFEPIYDFLTTGHFHRSGDICSERLYKELDFWRIKKDFFAPCCMTMATGESEGDDETPNGNKESINYGDQFDGVCWDDQRRKLWLLMEDPDTSTAAKIFALVSIIMVLASVTGMILGSTSEWQTVNYNATITGAKFDFRPHSTLEFVELTCIIWFTFEYFARFIVCARKKNFLLQPLNVIDSLTIIPFYVEILLSACGFGIHTFGDFRGLATVMRVVRIMRVARIFKLARYSSGLKSFGTTVKTSLPELSMLILFLLTTVIFFSTLMYFAERDEPNTKFKSIPHAGWWCIVTMTTVGYGDYYPETLFGKLIASCASISGVLVLAFPITMIVENFSRNYDNEKHEYKRVNRRRRMATINN